MTRVAVVFGLVVFGLVVVLRGPQTMGSELGRRHYGIWIADVRVGTETSTFVPRVVDGAPGWRHHIERIQRARFGDFGVQEGRSETWTDFDRDLRPVRSRSTWGGPTGKGVLAFEFAEDRVTWVDVQSGWETHADLRVDGDLVVEPEVYFIALARQDRLRARARFEVKRPEFPPLGVHAYEYEVLGRVRRPDGAVAWRIGNTDALSGDKREVYLVDADGRILESGLGPVDTRLLGPDEPRAPPPARGLELRSEPEIAPEHLRSLRSLTVAAELATPHATFPTNDYQQVLRRSNATHRLRLIQNRPRLDDALLRPLECDGENGYLAADPLRDVDAWAIRTTVERALRGERRAARCVDLLCRWVHEHVDYARNAADLRASRVLETRKGDCSEQANLYVALARAAGIPSRRVLGLALGGGSFDHHAWAESWLGRWVPVDPTVGQVGTPAAYVSFGPEVGHEGMTDAASVAYALSFAGSFHLVEIDLAGQVFRDVEAADVNWRVLPDARVVLRSGLTFGVDRQAGGPDDLLFRTPYGETHVTTADVRYLEVGRRRTYMEKGATVSIELPVGWSFRPTPRGKCALFQADTKDAAGALVLREAPQGLDRHARAVRETTVPRGRLDATRPTSLRLGGDEVPAVVLDVSDVSFGTETRYRIVAWLRNERGFALILWTKPVDLRRYEADFTSLVEGLRLE